MKKNFLSAFLAVLLAGGLFVSERLGHTRIVERAGLSAKLPEIGEKVDELDGVAVYYNGSISNVSGRNAGPDGYNIGQKHQCVEFVKRYYLEAKGHKMPNPWGHAKDFFNAALPDGALNQERGLRQYRNGGKNRPEPGDLLVMGGNKYGHVGIISSVGEEHAELVQQNPGPREPARVRIALVEKNGHWTLLNDRILGWLRLD